MKSIIIFGGSFDPIHNGHLRTANAASEFLNSDVIFVPAKNPRWKETSETIEDRLNMLNAALKEENNPRFSVDLYEVNSDAEINYSIETVRYLRKKYPDTKLYFLIGADSVNTFPRWKEAEELAKIATPVYCPRPGIEVEAETIDKFKMIRLPFEESGEVSSTAVRNLETIDIPVSVREYIEENRLYFIKKMEALLKESRLGHSIRVAALSYQIAKENGLEPVSKAYIAGLLHDIGKHLSIEEQKSLVKEHYPQYLDFPDWSYHQFAGAIKANELFGVTDEAILDAIAYHTTGKGNMSPLGKIVYAADKIEPGRGYDSSEYISACYKDIDLGFKVTLQAEIDYLTQVKGVCVDNELTKELIDQYLGKGKK